MVREAPHRCYFCEHARTCNHPLELLGNDAYLKTFGRDKLAEAIKCLGRAGTPLELEEGKIDSHVASSEHKVSIAAVLRNRTECDRILRRLRPSESEKLLLQQCKSALQRALKPAAIWWTGSIGKGTSLSGSHDVDVCVDLGDSYAREEHVLQEITWRLEHSDSVFEVKRIEKKLVLARFEACIAGKHEALELDILPHFAFGRAQVRHFEIFSKMNAAQKDAVRFLKAWCRLSLKVPGILLEAVVHQSILSTSVASHVQGYFIEALEALSSRRQWPDPTDCSLDLGRSLEETAWDKLEALAKQALALRVVQLEHSDWCKQSHPCIHGMKLIVGQGWSYDLGEMNAFHIVELYTRLGLRLPAHFKDYPKVKDPNLRKEACENNFWSFWQEEFLIDDFLNKSIRLGDRYVMLVRDLGTSHHPQARAVVGEFENLMNECSGHQSSKVQARAPIVASLFALKVEEAKKHTEAVTNEAEERRARTDAMRREEMRRRDSVHSNEEQTATQNVAPGGWLVFALVLYASIFWQWWVKNVY